MSIFTDMELQFKAMLQRSEAVRQSIHQDFAAFINNDYEEITRILKKITLNNPYSADTLNDQNFYFQHIDILDKILTRLSSGIYTQMPIREIYDVNGEVNVEATDKLNLILEQINYHGKVKEAFKKAIYFNCLVVNPVFDINEQAENKKFRLDVITPDNFAVKTKENYLEMKAIAIRKADENNEVYLSVWTEEEHYNKSGLQEWTAPNNEEGINPFSPVLPFSVLRIKEGTDFYGEPNWNLYLNQRSYDIRLTDLDRSEVGTIFNIWVGTNTKFAKDETFRPGELKQIESNSEYPASLQNVSGDIDYTSIRENIDWKNKSVMNSEGLSAQSGSVDVASESGVKREMDEVELKEKRENYKETLYAFEIDLLNKIRMVWNEYNPTNQIADGEFDITFSEEQSTETVQDKIARREMEKKFGLKDEVDFVMEDFEISEAEAIQHIKARQERKALLNLNPVANEDNQ